MQAKLSSPLLRQPELTAQNTESRPGHVTCEGELLSYVVAEAVFVYWHMWGLKTYWVQILRFFNLVDTSLFWTNEAIKLWMSSRDLKEAKGSNIHLFVNLSSCYRLCRASLLISCFKSKWRQNNFFLKRVWITIPSMHKTDLDPWSGLAHWTCNIRQYLLNLSL